MRILAVQPDANVLELLVHLLMDRPDYDAVAARNLDAATTLLSDPATQPFDCALVNADVDRVQTLQFISNLRAQSDMPVLSMSTETSKPTLDALFTAGVTDVVTKPMEMSVLRGKLALLVQALPEPTDTIDATAARYAALPIFDVRSFVPQFSFENYGKQLVRNRHSGACVFGVALNDIALHHAQLSAFAFHSMIMDVAEIISATSDSGSCLLTYAGDGLFLGITDAGSRLLSPERSDAINAALAAAAICDDADVPLDLTISSGHILRLGMGRSSCETIAEARHSAEKARKDMQNDVAPFVLMDRIA